MLSFMPSEVWDRVWRKKKVVSDYSLKLYAFLDGISRQLKPHSRVLEAGCGSGQGLSSFKNHYAVGLDLSAEALKSAKQFCSRTVNASIFEMPFKDNSFDLVYNSGVIEHFPFPENIRAVKEMSRVAKKGGKVIIIVPNSYCLWFRLWKFLATKLKGGYEFGYEESYSPKRLKETIQAAGLKPVRFFGLQALPPLATNNSEALPQAAREKLSFIDALLPFKQYYAYGLGIECLKQ